MSSYVEKHPHYRELDVAHPGHTIRLIAPDLAHAPASLKWLSDAEVGQHMGGDFSVVSLETEEFRLKRIIESTDEYSWMIEVDGEVVGNVCINSIAEQSEKRKCRAGSIAILIGEKNLWGKRIASAVLSSVLDWAFGEAQFAVLLARVVEENPASVKSFLSLGFQQTGAETEEVAGKMFHWNHYTMTKEQWQQSSL